MAEDTSPSSQVSTTANARQKLSVHSLLLQSDFIDDSRDTVISATEQSQDQQTQGPEVWSTSTQSMAVDPLFGNLDPFGISYWDGFVGGTGDLYNQTSGLPHDVDSFFDGLPDIIS